MKTTNILKTLLLTVLPFILYYASYSGRMSLKSSSTLLTIIENKTNLSDVYDAYFILANREDPIAIKLALKDIKSEDDYLWLNASHYLGQMKRVEAIPYLIKALRHTAWRDDEKRVIILQELTSQKIGVNFFLWKKWWMDNNPQKVIDWNSSLGRSPR